MSLRATERARVWRIARERLAKRPKLFAEYYRSTLGAVAGNARAWLAGVSLPVPVFVAAVQLADAPVFVGGRIGDGVSLVAAGQLGASLLFAWIWHHTARFDGLWSVLLAVPFSEALMARHWLIWRVGFAGVFIAPLATCHAIVLNGQQIGWARR